MKRLTFLVLFFPLLISCTSREKSDLERRREQIHADRERAAKMEADRIQKSRNDSLAAIAWGDAIWGMTRNEVLKTKAFRNGKDYGYTIEMNEDRKQKTREIFRLKNLMSLRAYINDDCLSGIFLDSWGVKTRQFDELVTECISLKNNFYRLYGTPSKNNEVSFSGFDKDGNQLVAEYKTGNKTITIILQKKEYEYCYKVSIFPLTANRKSLSLSPWLEKFDSDSNRPDDVTIFSF
ncbi:MAG: hypothetical protein IJ064_05875 [Bacteroidaceae bacterium]|nr:hypothetical protein [Bacteroidaceae bacterium]